MLKNKLFIIVVFKSKTFGDDIKSHESNYQLTQYCQDDLSKSSWIYFDLSFKEQSACMFMLNKVKDVITEIYQPDGFNIGINVGEKAGQTVNHVHIHLIPRYTGDVDKPRGGVRGVIPDKRSY